MWRSSKLVEPFCTVGSAPSKRENEFRKILEQPTFKPIEKQLHFWNYEKVEKLFNAEKDTHELRKQII